jgi:undecaprenyl-diphosphatase
MLIDILLGAIQGAAEWLPVSSEGVAVAAYSLLKGPSLAEATAYALWLHLGTVCSALIVFRADIVGLVREAVSVPRRPSPLLSYLVISTLTSGVIAFPLLLLLGQISARLGALSMVVIGVFMFITGGVQLRKRVIGTRRRADVTAADALLAGIAQGIAVLPGLSRSGLTLAALLARRVDRRESLVLSFLMSIPASTGAALYAGIGTGLITTKEGLLAGLVAAVVGLATIRALLAVASRINFGVFVLGIGGVLVAGGLWQALG